MAPKEKISLRGWLAFQLFRRHVLHGAENRSWHGKRSAHGRGSAGISLQNFLVLRQTEIEQFRAGLRQHYVRGFQVAMDNSLPVGFVESVGNLRGEAQQLGGCERP